MGFSPDQVSAISLGTNIFGMANSAIGSYYGAKSQSSSLRFQADMADINARIAETGAQSELTAGEKQVATQTLKAGQLKSAQRTAMAANGIDLGEGNAAEIQASTDIIKEIDKNTQESNSLRSAWGYRMQAVNARSEAMVKRASGSNVSPFGSAAMSMLGGAGRVASSWYDYTKSIDAGSKL